MSGVMFILVLLAVFVATVIIIDRRQAKSKRVMREGKLLRSEYVSQGGDTFYVEQVVCKGWHECIHTYYMIYNRLIAGQTIVEERWSYEDFCNVSFRLESCTCVLIRQVDVIALVRSSRPMPISEFDRMAMPLIM